MDYPAKNAIVVFAGALCLTVGYLQQQLSSHPADGPSPDAQYSGGTVVTQPMRAYIAGPPRGPVDGGYVIRELRWGDN